MYKFNERQAKGLLFILNAKINIADEGMEFRRRFGTICLSARHSVSVLLNSCLNNFPGRWWLETKKNKLLKRKESGFK